MFRILYDLFIVLYEIAIKLSPSEKAKMWRSGRQDLFQSLEKQDLKGCVWFHCASVGEFEQARPLIEAVKRKGEDKILLTFFSPSGYEIQKQYQSADYVCYLPIDKPSQVSQMYAVVKPAKLIFVKYELWYHLMRLGLENEVELYLIAARFRPEQAYFKWWASAFLRLLKKFNGIYVQDKASVLLLEKFGFQNVELSGDPRFDRVRELKFQSFEFDRILSKNKKLLIAGSTWQKDEILLKKWHEGHAETWNLILVPHEWNEHRKQSIIKLFGDNLSFYSEGGVLNGSTSALVLDTKGMLSTLYRFADLSYVGGGFGAGIHNTLEALVYGNPVLFGPNFKKFGEAKEAIEFGFAFSVKSEGELDEAIERLLTKDFSAEIDAYFASKGSVSEHLSKSIFHLE